MPAVFHSGPYNIEGGTLAVMTAQAAVQLSRHLCEIDPWARMDYKASTVATYLERQGDGGFSYQINVGPETAGAVVVRAPWLRGPYLEFLGILPQFQNRGLGNAVLDWLETCARNASNSNLWVATSTFNTDARRFYERSGYREVAVLDALVAPGFEEVLFRKKL